VTTTPEETLAALAPAAAAPQAAIAVATIQGERRGVACQGEGTGPRTRFELGSLTMTFTALLLAEMSERGEVRLDDPIARHLPPHARPHRGAAGKITPLHLATHTAGLPTVPANLVPGALPRWRTAPYAAYTTGQLLAATARIRPRPAPGRRVRYSTFGVGLLGHLLAEAAGDTYPHLIAARLCAPLGLDDTDAAPGPGPVAADLATGHHHRGRPLPPMTSHGLPAAGGLRTSAHDMLHFLAAHLHPSTAPASLDAALTVALRPRLAFPRGNLRTALIWNVRTFPDHDLYFHSGANRGFTTFAGFSPQTATALAAFTNTGPPPLHAPFVQTAYTLLKSLIQEARGTGAG
jgi:serine-type D-Ala-D-Ala carboxypeptidase/endopeptidase